MKKAFLFALAALCVSAVQAVTLKWTEQGSFDKKTVATPNEGERIVESATIAAIATFKGPGNANFLECQFGNPNSGKLAMRMLENSTISAASGITPKGTAVSVSPEEQFTVMMVFKKVSDIRMEMEFYINGTCVHTDGYNTNSTTGGFNQLDLLAWENSQYLDLQGVAFYEGAATSEEAAKFHQTKNFASVPEPTALALLALGVAGLALKRKVA